MDIKQGINILLNIKFYYFLLFIFILRLSFLACLFQRKSQAIVIMLNRYSCCCRGRCVWPITQKVLKVLAPKLELFIITRCSCKTKGITLNAIFLELCPYLIKKF